MFRRYVCILIGSVFRAATQLPSRAECASWVACRCCCRSRHRGTAEDDRDAIGGTVADEHEGDAQADVSDLPLLVSLSILFLAAVRALAFLTIGVLSAVALHSTSDEDSLPGAEEEYALSTQAVVAVGDSVFVSLYLLLAGLWVEAQAAVRRHLYDPVALRSCWITAWLVMNTSFYVLQAALLVALFWSDTLRGRAALLLSVYSVTATVSFLLPVVVALGCCCTRAAFRGFPETRSIQLRLRARSLTVTLVLWSLGRLAWGARGVADAMGLGQVVSGSDGSLQFALTTAAVFFLGELVPATQALVGLGLGADGVLRVGDGKGGEGAGGGGWGPDEGLSPMGASAGGASDGLGAAAARPLLRAQRSTSGDAGATSLLGWAAGRAAGLFVGRRQPAAAAAGRERALRRQQRASGDQGHSEDDDEGSVLSLSGDGSVNRGPRPAEQLEPGLEPLALALAADRKRPSRTERYVQL